MNEGQFWSALNWLTLQTGMNLEYYQKMAARWSLYDRIGVAVVICLTVVCLVIVAKLASGYWKAGLEILGACIPMVLFALPFGEWRADAERHAAEWGDVKMSVKELSDSFALIKNGNDSPVPEKLNNELQFIQKKIGDIQKFEPASDRELVKECWGDQLEKVYGQGVRSTEQAKSRLKEEGVPIIEQQKPPAPQEKTVSLDQR